MWPATVRTHDFVTLFGSRRPALQAFSSASTACKSSGNAYGCGAAFAYAKAWAIAVASAHAEAFALAFNECECRDHDQKAIATDYGSAESFKKLVAEVEATAQANVCVSGDASASASAVASCTQKVYANVFAKVRSSCLPLECAEWVHTLQFWPRHARERSVMAGHRTGNLKREFGHSERPDDAGKVGLVYSSHPCTLCVGLMYFVVPSVVSRRSSQTDGTCRLLRGQSSMVAAIPRVACSQPSPPLKPKPSLIRGTRSIAKVSSAALGSIPLRGRVYIDRHSFCTPNTCTGCGMSNADC